MVKKRQSIRVIFGLPTFKKMCVIKKINFYFEFVEFHLLNKASDWRQSVDPPYLSTLLDCLCACVCVCVW